MFGEVVFSTSMVGYTEALTDPSYHGQILSLTYPMVGNYGVPKPDIPFEGPFESYGIKATGLVIHDLCEAPSHWQSSLTLDEWLQHNQIPGISGIDTRYLTKKLRTRGVMLGAILHDEKKVRALRCESFEDPNKRNLAAEVSTRIPVWHKGETAATIVLIDCGVKFGIIRNLLKEGFSVVRVPYDVSLEEVLAYEPRGVVVSNGPGNPEVCRETIATIRELIEQDMPVMGICLGHQLLALAARAHTFKMKFGHRSQNQPVLELGTNRCYITTQNHGYAVDPESLQGTRMEITMLNANDKTVEGIRHREKKAFGVQFHPEANPGPYDTGFLFERFKALTG